MSCPKSLRSKCGKMIASGSTLRKNRFGDSGASHTAPSSVRTCVTPCSELATPRASPHAAAACATARAFDSSAMWAAPHEHAQTTLGASELSSERGSSSDQKESELHLESTCRLRHARARAVGRVIIESHPRPRANQLSQCRMPHSEPSPEEKPLGDRGKASSAHVGIPADFAQIGSSERGQKIGNWRRPEPRTRPPMAEVSASPPLQRACARLTSSISMQGTPRGKSNPSSALHS